MIGRTMAAILGEWPTNRWKRKNSRCYSSIFWIKFLKTSYYNKMNVLTSITVLGFLIFFHEMGHFFAAILQGIYVDGFSIGFGPSIIQKRYKDITHSLRAFPLGALFPFLMKRYIIHPKDPNLLKNRPVIQRVIVISAGVFANLILAYTILIINVTTIGIPFDPEPEF